eukprot:scaffold449868_cov21-Prasinocladus_malaysianus.AAC.1
MIVRRRFDKVRTYEPNGCRTRGRARMRVGRKIRSIPAPKKQYSIVANPFVCDDTAYFLKCRRCILLKDYKYAYYCSKSTVCWRLMDFLAEFLMIAPYISLTWPQQLVVGTFARVLRMHTGHAVIITSICCHDKQSLQLSGQSK